MDGLAPGLNPDTGEVVMQHEMKSFDFIEVIWANKQRSS